jgi:hypothetical protein
VAIGTLGCAVALLTMLAVTRRDPGRGRRRRKGTAPPAPDPEAADEWLGPLKGLGVRPNTRRNRGGGPSPADPGWLPDQDQRGYPRYREWGEPAGDWAPVPDEWNRDADWDDGYGWGTPEPAAGPGPPGWADADPQAPGADWAPEPVGDLEADYSTGPQPTYRPVPPSLTNQPAGYLFAPGPYPAQAPQPDGPWPGGPDAAGPYEAMPAQPDGPWADGPYAAPPAGPDGPWPTGPDAAGPYEAMPAQPDGPWAGGAYPAGPPVAPDDSWEGGPYVPGPPVAEPDGQWPGDPYLAGPPVTAATDPGGWVGDPHAVMPADFRAPPPGDPYAAGPHAALPGPPDGPWADAPGTDPQVAVPGETDGPGPGGSQPAGPAAQAPGPGGAGDDDDTIPLPVITGTGPPGPGINRNEPAALDGPGPAVPPSPALAPASIWLPPAGPEPAAEWAETPPGPEPAGDPLPADPLDLSAVPAALIRAADALLRAPADAVPGSAQEKMEQIKELYLTAEAIGEDALTKHFELLSQRQHDLIREFFEKAGLGANDAPAKPGGDSAPDSASLPG